MEQYKQMIYGMAEKSNPKLEVDKTALLIIDLVNDGNDDNGFFKTKLGFDISLLKEIEPNVVKLINASKSQGMPVIGVQAIYDFDYISKPMRENFEAMGIEGGLAPKGAWGSEIIPKVKNSGLDLILVKSHYSAFAPGRTFGYRSGNKEIENYMKLPASKDSNFVKKGKSVMKDYFEEAQKLYLWDKEDIDHSLDDGGKVISLDHYFTLKGIDTLIVTGASTHVCVNSTIAGASERGYKVFEPIDAVASEGIPNEGHLRHYIYSSNDGMFKSELTTTKKILESIIV